VGQIIAVMFIIVSAFVILSSQLRTDNLLYVDELERTKEMLSLIDRSVGDYILAKEKMGHINFDLLDENKYMAANYTLSGSGFLSKIEFPHSNIIWQIIPNPNDNKISYKLLVDIRNNVILSEKISLSEKYIGEQFCEKIYFGEYIYDSTVYDAGNEDYLGGGTTSDGLFSCTLYKIK